MEICRLLGDDTSGGLDANDSNLVCQAWSGLSLPQEPNSGMAGDRVQFLDLLGTGRTQVVYYRAGRFDSAGVWQEDGRWEVYAPIDLARSGQALDRIHKVTNGLGASASVEYADGLVAGLVPSLVDASSANPAQALSYPQRPIRSADKLVSRLITSNGVSANRSTRYRYADAATDVAGRGNLGFAKFTSTDEQTGIVSTTNYRQDWPHVGQIRSSTTSSNSTANAVVLNQTDNSFELQNLPFANGNRTVFSYLANSKVTRKDLDGSGLGSTFSSNQYTDGWGNLTRQTVQVSDPDSVPVEQRKVFTQETVSEFDNNSTDWLLGLPNKLLTSKTDPDSGTLTRSVGYKYYPNTGLLEKETLEPNQPKLSLVTSYRRNAFGLVDKTTKTWLADPANKSQIASTEQETVYDTKGRFPVTSYNALRHKTSLDHDAATGARMGSGLTFDIHPLASYTNL